MKSVVDSFVVSNKQDTVAVNSPYDRRTVSCYPTSLENGFTKSKVFISDCGMPDHVLKSRYGRVHKPKFSSDFLLTDKKVAAVLGLNIKTTSVKRNRILNSAEVRATANVVLEGSPMREKVKNLSESPSAGAVMRTLRESSVYPFSASKPQTLVRNVKGYLIKRVDAVWKPPQFKVGDLVWARVSGYPFWPAVVTTDSETQSFTKNRTFGQLSKPYIHVNFFEDMSQHSWLPYSSAVPYNLLSVSKATYEALSKVRKCQKKTFYVKPSQKIKFLSAVAAANKILQENGDKRLERSVSHDPSHPEQTGVNNLSKSIEIKQPPKRENMSYDIQMPAKKAKTEISFEDKCDMLQESRTQLHNDSTRKESGKLDNSLKCFLEKDFELSNKLLEIKGSEKQKIPEKRRNNTTKDVKSTNVADMSPRKEGTSRKISKSSSVSNTVNDERFCGSGLFRGICKAKVCLICLKPRNLIKCCGPCFGNYHPECVAVEMRKEQAIADGINLNTVKTVQHRKVSESEEELIIERKPLTENSMNETKKWGMVQGVIRDKGEISINVDCTSDVSDKHCIVKTKMCLANNRNCKTFNGTPTEIASKEVPKINNSADNATLNGFICDKDKQFRENKLTAFSVLCGKSTNANMEDAEIQTVGESECSIGVICGKTSAVKQETEDKDSSGESYDEKFLCHVCKKGGEPRCFACGKETKESNRQQCCLVSCGKYYHTECLNMWPQATVTTRLQQKNPGKDLKKVLTCPLHKCHTCVSDDPHNATVHNRNDALVRCVRCPSAYHADDYCVPAGCKILSSTQLLCARHYRPIRGGKIPHANTNWCFICCRGGLLICCDLCPTSFHTECLHMSSPLGHFVCDDCRTGRFPIFGEIVWVKLGANRWWPAKILFPNEVPLNIDKIRHTCGEFCVKFFGTDNHIWVNRGRVFLFQEGDGAVSSGCKTKKDEVFLKALEAAKEALKKYTELKKVHDAKIIPSIKPPPYIRIKMNKSVRTVHHSEGDTSNLSACECDPKAENPCGPDSNCLNRILHVECSPLLCKAGLKCCNRQFERRHYPELQPYLTNDRGWGLKTLVNLRKGDFVIEYVGEMINEVEYHRRIQHKHEEKDDNFYFLAIDKDRVLDSGSKGNVARFMNHSCRPNCETQKWTVNGDTRVGIFTLEDIPANTELTFNYNLVCIGTDRQQCMCGASNCSGFIGVKSNKPVEDKSRLSKQVERKHQTNGEETCFGCGNPGELIACSDKNCSKRYHKDCVGHSETQKKIWICPWHYCNECNKRTVRSCNFCTNAFCLQHSKGLIRTNGKCSYVCSYHDKNGVTTGDQKRAKGLKIKIKS